MSIRVTAVARNEASPGAMATATTAASVARCQRSVTGVSRERNDTT